MAADYAALDVKDITTFFQTIQNKLHFAATGETAAELITQRADHTSPNMGLTTWKNAPDGQIRKADVSTAKNYLSQDEIDGLNRIVVMWLDFAEDQAKRRKQVFLRDWEAKLDQFLEFNDRDVLPNAGTVSGKAAKIHAEAQYEAYAADRRRLLEAEGERAAIAALEEQAKSLPTPDKK